jgi:hypothetical protein
MAVTDSERLFIDDLIILVNGTLAQMTRDNILEVKTELIKKISEVTIPIKPTYEELIHSALNIMDDSAHISGNETCIIVADKIDSFYSSIENNDDGFNLFKAIGDWFKKKK